MISVGYHYRVQMRDQQLADSQKRDAEARVEVQVASVLMHAFLAQLHPDLERRPISEQIIDQLLLEDDARYEVYQRVRAAVGDEPGAPQAPDVHEALGFFMAQWIEFERRIRLRMRGVQRGPPVPSPPHLLREGVIDRATAERLEPIRRLRNDVVHGVFAGEPTQLREAGERLSDIAPS